MSFVDVEVAVGEDVEARALLIADDGGVGVLEFFAEADVEHAGVEWVRPTCWVAKPAGAGKETCGGYRLDCGLCGGEYG